MPLGGVVSAFWWKSRLDAANDAKDQLEEELAKLQRINQDLNRALSRRPAEILSAGIPTPERPVVSVPKVIRKPAPDPCQAEYDELQGTWVLVWEEVPSDVKGLLWIIEGKHVTADHTAWKSEFTYKVYRNQHPKAFDFSSDTTNFLGIYELEGQVLRICFVPESPGQRPKRPTEFKAEAAGGLVCHLVFRRVNDKELRKLNKAEELQDLQEQLSRIQTELQGERAFLLEVIPYLFGEYTRQQVRLNRMECRNRIAWLEEAEKQIKQLVREASDPEPDAPDPTPEAPAPAPPSPEEQASVKLKWAKDLEAKGETARAKVRYREIVKDFPTTKAAEEARKLLKKLEK
jgi:uncharacterized protein (TIGR03067 family)